MKIPVPLQHPHNKYEWWPLHQLTWNIATFSCKGFAPPIWIWICVQRNIVNLTSILFGFHPFTYQRKKHKVRVILGKQVSLQFYFYCAQWHQELQLGNEKLFWEPAMREAIWLLYVHKGHVNIQVCPNRWRRRAKLPLLGGWISCSCSSSSFGEGGKKKVEDIHGNIWILPVLSPSPSSVLIYCHGRVSRREKVALVANTNVFCVLVTRDVDKLQIFVVYKSSRTNIPTALSGMRVGSGHELFYVVYSFNLFKIAKIRDCRTSTDFKPLGNEWRCKIICNMIYHRYPLKLWNVKNGQKPDKILPCFSQYEESHKYWTLLGTCPIINRVDLKQTRSPRSGIRVVSWPSSALEITFVHVFLFLRKSLLPKNLCLYPIHVLDRSRAWHKIFPAIPKYCL